MLWRGRGRGAAGLGRRRGRSAAAGAVRGGGRLWPPRSRAGRMARGADDGYAGRHDDGVRRHRRLLRPGDRRRAARDGGRPRGWGDAREAGGARSAPSRRDAETCCGGSRFDGTAVDLTGLRARGAAGGGWGAPGRPGDGRGRGNWWRRCCADDGGDGTGRSCATSASTTSRKTTIAPSITAAGAAAVVAGDYCGWCAGGDNFPARARGREQLPH